MPHPVGGTVLDISVASRAAGYEANMKMSSAAVYEGESGPYMNNNNN